MYTLSINMWFQKLIRQFFFNLDKVIYGFITTIYDLLISIARTSILSQADIINMADKIYKLLAVFMVFKVTFSLIMYVVNPDDFSDKSKGVSKLGLNIVISLALLILVPYMFSAAFRLQTIILEDNSLAELIMGSDKDDEGNSNASVLNDAGDTIAFYSIQPFFLPNVSIDELRDCITIDNTCYDAMRKVADNDTLVNNYQYGIENENMGLMFRQDLAIKTDSGNDNFIMDYRFILSTVLGVVIVLILITFCMDVALRSIKLSFLQLIAPIPIISYVDPKSGKDGLFKKWYQMCFKTYASLFLRLIALYFAVYIISRIGKLTDIVDGSQVTNGFIKIFIIIGALMFAKQLPKILEGLGVKLDGGFQLNPLKKFEDQAIGGKKITSFAKGAAGAGLAGAAALGTNLIANKGNIFSAVAGGVSASARGLRGALKGEKFGKNFSNSYSAAMKARTNRDSRQELGVNGFDVMSENIRRNMSIPNEALKYKMELEHLKEFTESGKAAKSRAEGEIDKKASMIEVDGKNLGALRDAYEILKNTQVQRNAGESDVDYQRRVQEHAKLAAEANAEYFKARKKVVNAYVENASNLAQSSISMNGSSITGFDSAFSGIASHDTIVSSNVQKMQQMNTDYNMGQTVNTSDIGATIQSADDKTASIQGSAEYRRATLIEQQAQREKSGH